MSEDVDDDMGHTGVLSSMEEKTDDDESETEDPTGGGSHVNTRADAGGEHGFRGGENSTGVGLRLDVSSAGGGDVSVGNTIEDDGVEEGGDGMRVYAGVVGVGGVGEEAGPMSSW